MRRSPERAKVQTDMAFYNEMTYVSREFLDEFPDQTQYKHYFDAFNNALLKFHELIEKNGKIVQTISNLNQTMLNNAQKVKDILAQVGYDKEEIKQLSIEYENATKKLEVHRRKELENQNTVSGLKFDFDSYNTIAQEYFGKEKEKEDIQNENDSLRKEMEENKQQIEELTQQLNEAKEKMNKSQTELNEVKQTRDALKTEKDETKNTFLTMKQDNLDCIAEMERTSENIHNLEEETQRLHEVLKNTKIDPNLKKQIAELKVEMKKQKSKKEKREHTIEIKTKSLNQIKKESNGFISYANKIKEKIQNRDERIEELSVDIKEQDKIYNEVKPTADKVTEKHRQVKADKIEYRKKTKDLLKSVIGLEFDNIKITNQSKMTERHTVSEQYSINTIEKDIVREKNSEIEARNKQSVLSIETLNIRKDKQKMMENATKLLAEIEEKETEVSQIKLHWLTTRSEIEKLKQQNEQMINHLNSIKEKTSKQASLVEKLRTERNMYKKMSETATADTVILQQQFDELLVKIKEMTAKIDDLIEAAKADHDAAEIIKEANEYLEKMKAEAKLGAQSSEKVNSQLIQEAVNLQNLLHKSEWDFRQQKKEYAMLVNTYHIVANQLLQKEKKIETLKSDIQSSEAVLIKSKQQYKEKIDELLHLHDDFGYYYGMMENLEQKWKYTERLKVKHLEISEALDMLQLKKGTLLDELRVPRNVHRYTLLAASNPELAKQYRYVYYVHFRIQEATNKLIKLKEQKEKLISELRKKEEAEEHATKSLTAQEVMNRIRVYQDDLKRKDQELKEMEKIFNNNQFDMWDGQFQVEDTRMSLTQKRASTARMRSRRTMSRRKADDGVFYLTSATSGVPDENTNNQKESVSGNEFLPQAPKSARDSRRFRSKAPSPIHEPNENSQSNQNTQADLTPAQKIPTLQIHTIPKITKIKKKKDRNRVQSARRVRQPNI